MAAAHGVSIGWIGKKLAQFHASGYEALESRSRAARGIRNRTPAAVEDRIIRLRKQLAEEGFDAEAATIHYHLSIDGGEGPSVCTIWRILRRRGFITPQPQKRPKTCLRFKAQLPNELWQSDVTGWELAGAVGVEIVTFLDDHSRLVLASRVVPVATARNALTTFRAAAGRYGTPRRF